MKIAMIGHKDFPCRSGGVEVVVYELATGLAKRGVDVTVYNRGREKNHNRYRELGVNVIRSFTFKKQSLNAMVYSFTATFNALLKNYDIIHYHAIGPCVPIIVAHLFGKKTVATVHGLNWKVDKWNSFASRYLKLGERIAAKYADEVITLSEEMHRYFIETYGRDTTLIKNAVTPIPRTDDEIIKEKFNLHRGEYILYIGRISPEKGVQDLIRAYKKTSMSKKLAIAGEMPNNDFGREIHSLTADSPDIVCTGFAEGELMHSLYSNCALYVLPSHTEGLPLTLLEAMSCGAPCLTSDIPENREVIKDFGETFHTNDIDDLAKCIEKYSDDESLRAMSEDEMKYIYENYSYKDVIDGHIRLYNKVIGNERCENFDCNSGVQH